MTLKYIHPGDTLDFTAGAAVSSDDEMLVGDHIFGIVLHDALINTTANIGVSGVWDLTKEAPLVISEGELIYWDDGNSQCTTTATGNLLIGVCTVDAGSAAVLVRTKLTGLGAALPAVLDDGATLPVLIAPGATVRETWVAPIRGTITGLGWTCETQPSSVLGTYTAAIANATDGTNQLVAATADLNGAITADTYLGGTLTATAADLNFDQSDVFTFTFASSNLDLLGAGLCQSIYYRAR